MPVPCRRADWRTTPLTTSFSDQIAREITPSTFAGVAWSRCSAPKASWTA
jgi:hypothetical protein